MAGVEDDGDGVDAGGPMNDTPRRVGRSALDGGRSVAVVLDAGRRRPELDGLRGFAVALVVFAHTSTGAWPANRGLLPIHSGGGLVGVQLFFVLSGYLITGLLLREHESTGVAIGAFYLRRCRRLLPALLFVCALFAIVNAVARMDAAGDMVQALTYTGDLPRKLGPGWLGHTWSLAVEEQFYLVWPFVVVALGSRRRVGWAASVVILTTVGLRAFGGFAATTVYEGLRWDAIAAGCLLACLPAWRPTRATIVAAGIVVAAYTLAAPHEYRSIDYIATIVAGVVLLSAAPALGWLRSRALVHLGTISYGLYLWHPLVLRFGPPSLVGLVVALTLAEMSWRYVEAPFFAARLMPEVGHREHGLAIVRGFVG